MKLFLVFASVFAFMSVEAKILNSNLDLRLQEKIESEIILKCAVGNGYLIENFTKTSKVKIDQGITDLVFESNFDFVVRIDQEMTDIYNVSVKSSRSDAYDHENQDWGIFSIDSVSECVLK